VPLRDAGAGDAVYLDPPHAARSRTSRFTAYTAEAWTEADDARVAAAFWALARRGVRVVLSQADTPRMRELLRGAEVETALRRGTVSSKAGGRQAVAEILAAAGPL
jgi:DNA adenine methylase